MRSATIAVSLWGLLMAVVLAVYPYPFPHRFEHDIDKPILALELAHNASDIRHVLQPKLQQHEKAYQAVLWNTRLDLIFIPLYVWYLWTLGYVTGRPGGLARLIGYAAVLAGFLDYVEDALIFWALVGGSPPIWIPSAGKWAVLGITLLLIGSQLAVSRGTLYSLAGDRLFGLLHLAGGSLLTGGVVLGEIWGYSAVELGGAVFLLTVFLNLLYVLVTAWLQWLPGSTPDFVEDFCQKRNQGLRNGASVALHREGG